MHTKPNAKSGQVKPRRGESNPTALLQGKKHATSVGKLAKSVRGTPSDPEVFRRKLKTAMLHNARADGRLCCEMCGSALARGDRGFISRGRSRHWWRLCESCGIAADARGIMHPVGLFLYEPYKPLSSRP